MPVWERLLAKFVLTAVDVGFFYLFAAIWTDADLGADLFTVGAILVMFIGNAENNRIVERVAAGRKRRERYSG